MPVPKPKPYVSWSSDPHNRWIDAGNTFGIHLMQQARDQALARIPVGTPDEVRKLIVDAIYVAIGGVMEILDGFPRCDVDEKHRISYELRAHVRSTATGETLETFELAPDGDGLCMGLAGWWNDDYGNGSALKGDPAFAKVVAEKYEREDFERHSQGPPCPECGQPLRTAKAQQCFKCGAKWHGDPTGI